MKRNSGPSYASPVTRKSIAVVSEAGFEPKLPITSRMKQQVTAPKTLPDLMTIGRSAAVDGRVSPRLHNPMPKVYSQAEEEMQEANDHGMGDNLSPNPSDTDERIFNPRRPHTPQDLPTQAVRQKR